MRTLERWRIGLLTNRRKGSSKRVANKFDDVVIAEVIQTACSPKYQNDTPYVMYVKLLEDQRYIASPRSIYHILKVHGLLTRRTNSAVPAKRHRPPERVATGPNQISRWDITYLHLKIKGFFVYAYIFLDIWSRKIVGWEIHNMFPVIHNILPRRIMRNSGLLIFSIGIMPRTDIRELAI